MTKVRLQVVGTFFDAEIDFKAGGDIFELLKALAKDRQNRNLNPDIEAPTLFDFMQLLTIATANDFPEIRAPLSDNTKGVIDRIGFNTIVGSLKPQADRKFLNFFHEPTLHPVKTDKHPTLKASLFRAGAFVYGNGAGGSDPTRFNGRFPNKNREYQAGNYYLNETFATEQESPTAYSVWQYYPFSITDGAGGPVKTTLPTDVNGRSKFYSGFELPNLDKEDTNLLISWRLITISSGPVGGPSPKTD